MHGPISRTGVKVIPRVIHDDGHDGLYKQVIRFQWKILPMEDLDHSRCVR